MAFEDEDIEQAIPEIIETSALQVMTQAELNTAVDIAKRYARDLIQCKKTTLQLAAGDKETAESCFFSLPRKKKNEITGKMEEVELEGESIRLAEIVLSSWKNVQFGTRIIAVDRVAKTVTAQAVVHDLENNTKSMIEETRNVSYKDGKLYSADMITMTGRGAGSIALRNATFKVIPKAFFRQIIKEIKLVAIGEKPGYLEDDKNFKKVPLEERIGKAVKFFTNWGISEARVFSALGVKALAELTEEHLIKLTGIKSGINQGEFSLLDAFPMTEADKAAEVGKNIVNNVKGKTQAAPEDNPSLIPPDDLTAPDPKATKKKEEKK
jgi:hypothetical protein